MKARIDLYCEGCGGRIVDGIKTIKLKHSTSVEYKPMIIDTANLPDDLHTDALDGRLHKMMLAHRKDCGYYKERKG